MARKAQVIQDASRGFPVGDERHHPHSRAATGTTQNFNFENTPEQRSPVESGGPPDGRGTGSRSSFRSVLLNRRKFRLRQGCHRWAQARGWAEHPVEAEMMDPWGWNERGQFLEQGPVASGQDASNHPAPDAAFGKIASRPASPRVLLKLTDVRI